MMKDLSIFHLANRATLEDVVSLGSRVETKVYRTVETPGPLFNLAVNVEIKSLVVRVDGVQLLPTTDIPGVGQFRLVYGEGPGGEDQVEVSVDQDFVELTAVYSKLTDLDAVYFELRGKGLRFVTDVFVGADRVEEIIPINDTKLWIRVPTGDAPGVFLENLRALVPLDHSPAASDIIVDLSTRSRAATGSKILIQRFLSILMSPEGANLSDLIPKGRTNTPQFRATLLSRTSMAVTITKNKMIRTTPKNATPGEVIVAAFVTGVTFLPDGSAEVSVKLKNRAGSTVSVPLSLGT